MKITLKDSLSIVKNNGGAITTNAFAQKTGQIKNTASKSLSRLLRAGLVARVKPGKYVLIDDSKINMLCKTFTNKTVNGDDVSKTFGIKRHNADVLLSNGTKNGVLKRVCKGQYRVVKTSNNDVHKKTLVSSSYDADLQSKITEKENEKNILLNNVAKIEEKIENLKMLMKAKKEYEKLAQSILG